MTAEADFSARPFSMRGEWDGKEYKGTDFLMLKVFFEVRYGKQNKSFPVGFCIFYQMYKTPHFKKVSFGGKEFMEFWNAGVTLLRTVVIVLGAALLTWGAINLMEGYGGDNPGANAHVR